jgi:uncharacterized membrane protein
LGRFALNAASSLPQHSPPSVFFIFFTKKTIRMIKKVSWALFAFFAILIGTMPFIILSKGMKFGIEEAKDAALYLNLFWKNSFYVHVIVGGLPLLLGWTQFIPKLRAKYPKVHRFIGKIYVVTFLITALTGFFISFYATGGLIAALGFGTVALIAFFTTLKAYLDIRKGDVVSHQKMMIYSYACCFAAVTFRFWQMILLTTFDDPDMNYKIASWIGWVPNLFVAYWMIMKKEKDAMNTPISFLTNSQ